MEATEKTKEEKKNITPIVENNFFKIEKFFAASIILVIFTSFYFLFIDEKNNEIDFALVPDLPESLEPDSLIQLLSTDYKFAVSFSILVVVLLFRPSGIFEGKKI